jgi:hypothetical protein
MHCGAWFAADDRSYKRASKPQKGNGFFGTHAPYVGIF